MATSLVDSPPAPDSAERPADPPLHAPAEQTPGQAPAPLPAAESCAHCGAPMAAGQDWCLQCGTPAGRGAGAPGWRPAATIVALTAALALAAAGAGYAALNTKTHKPRTVTALIAQTPAPATPSTPAPGTPTTIAPAPPATSVKPPTIPSPASTPSAAPTTPATSTGGQTTTGSAKTTTPEATGGSSTEPTPILLDTNAASTYNPYGYAAANFGDPSLTIDGDASTAWTALVDPATAPRLAEGVLIDVKTARRFASVKLTSSSPGMSVGIYGANGKVAPSSITNTAWIPLSHSRVLGKRHVTIKLLHAKRAFRFITLWISKAPASSIGTPAAPGHVSVNELELFAAS